jgi:hypothetical protein
MGGTSTTAKTLQGRKLSHLRIAKGKKRFNYPVSMGYYVSIIFELVV